MTWDGDDYQARFDSLAARGVDVHGEVAFVLGLDPVPKSVLDAGCGTGRVAIELARRGVAVVGVDVDASMLATARTNAPAIDWHEHDLATLDLGRTFDAVVMAGNVPLFTPRERRPRSSPVAPGTSRPAARSSPASSSAGATHSTSTTSTAPPPASRSPSATPPGTGSRSRPAATTPSPCTGARTGNGGWEGAGIAIGYDIS